MNAENKITVALAGNPNCGKSTLFNALTGSKQRVGNYPGVTVEKKEGFKIYKGYQIKFVDLPGTYSLSGISDDEVVAGEYLINEKPDMVINVVDASNLERNLYLFTQIAETNIPVIIALNMVDILKSYGKKISTQKMSDLLGVPVVATIGNKREGINNIFDCIISSFNDSDFKEQKAAKVDYGDDIKAETNEIEKMLPQKGILEKYPKSLISIKLLDNDLFANNLILKSKNGKKILERAQNARQHLKKHFNIEVEEKIAEIRYGFANSVAKTVVEDNENKKFNITDAIDKVAVDRFLGIPVFIGVVYIIFKFTFTCSQPFVNLFGKFFNWLGNFVGQLIPQGAVNSLIVDGIIGGVGGVLGFFPLILFMFFAIAFFEDTGYMARAAFIMDRVMEKFGLQGKAFLPFMISTNGCAVPGILASRTLDSKRDRLITMLVTPFMICGAKLPIFLVIIAAFFPKHQSAIMLLMYGLSIMFALGIAKLLSKTILKGEASNFVMELPPYHFPSLKSLFLKMWERGWQYVKKAGTVIVFISIIMWAGFAYPGADTKNLSKEEASKVQIEQSYCGKIGKFLEPIFKPIGMDGNRAVALIAGFAAKEVVVSTLGTLYSLGDIDGHNSNILSEKIASDKNWSPLKAISFLIFCLIYIPCCASLVIFYKESDNSIKWLAFLVIGTSILAWVCSFIVYQIGTFFCF